MKPFVLSPRVLIVRDDGCILLMKRSAGSAWQAGKWDLPGGKIDPGEGFAEALLREAIEETGLSITLERVAGAAEWEMPTRKVAYIIMEASIASGEVTLSEEHDEYRWATPDELPQVDLCEQYIPFAQAYQAKVKE